MDAEPITIMVDVDAAKAYRELRPEIRREVDFDISRLLRKLGGDSTPKDPTALFQLMDEISAQAQARGLTPEILESILNEK